MNDLQTFWFSTEEISNLWASLQESKDADPTVMSELQSVYEELSVAYVRAKWFTPELSRIAVSLGHEQNAIPIKMSGRELKSLQSLPLADSVNEVLG